MGGARWLVASAVAVGMLAAAAPASAGTGSINGTVTDAADDGIAGIYVCAHDRGLQGPYWGCDFTDGDGGYSITGLEPWEYTVWFRDESQSINYVNEYWENKPTRALANGVNVGTGAVDGIDAELATGAQITGTVTDEATGLPVEGVQACAPNVVQTEMTYCDRTDFEGRYAINSLATGSYRVEFSVTEAPNYVTQYYPGKASWSEAEPVAVTAGAITPSIDAEMRQGVRITGTLTEPGGAAVPWVPVCALDPVTEVDVQCTSAREDGTYSLAGLAPGSYKVGFAIDRKEEGLVLHPDGYVRQYFDHRPTFAEASLVGGVAGVYPGIDALLSQGPETWPNEPPAPPYLPISGSALWPLGPANTARKKCKKGFHRKKVKGKKRCVKKPGKARAKSGRR